MLGTQTNGIVEQGPREGFALGLSKNAPVPFGISRSALQKITSRYLTHASGLAGLGRTAQRKVTGALHMALQGCPFTQGRRPEEMVLF